MFRLFYDDRIQRITREEEHERFVKRCMIVMSILTAIPAAFAILHEIQNFLHHA